MLDLLRRFVRSVGVSPEVQGIVALITIGSLALAAVVFVVAWIASETGLPQALTVVLTLMGVAVLLGLVLMVLIWWEARKPYRSALAKVVRDYYAEWNELRHTLDPTQYGTASAKVGSGWADPEWAGEVYDRYGLPREERYGG